MSTYLLLIPADEAVWDRKSEAEKNTVYAAHDRFHEALAKGGHTILNTSPLTPSREAKVVEQLSGYYVIETDDEPGLLQACGQLAFDERVVEVRRTTREGD